MQIIMKGREITIQDSHGFRWSPEDMLPAHVLRMNDAADTHAMLEQLVDWEAQFIEQEFEGIYFPQLGTVEEVDDAAEWVGHMQRSPHGNAEYLSRQATSFPKIGDGSKHFIQPIVPLGIGYTISYFQDRARRRFGINLDSQSQAYCAEDIDRKLDEAWHVGGKSPDSLQVGGMFQMFNGGGATQLAAGTTLPKVALTTGVSGNTWNLKTGAEIDNDIAAGIAAVMLASNNTRRVTKIAMGLKSWVEITKHDIVTENGGIYRLDKYLRETYSDITWIVDTWFDSITLTNSNETFTNESAVLFYTDGPTNWKFRANRRETVRPYETGKGFQMIGVNCFGLTAGIQFFNNYFGAYMKANLPNA